MKKHSDLLFASWCSTLALAHHVTAQAVETLEEAIIKDMLPPSSSSCSPPSGQTSHTFIFESSQEQCQWFEGWPGESEKYGAPWSNHEKYVFAAKMSHTDSTPNHRSWDLRIGTGGNIYGFYGPAGEMIAPQKRVDSPWIDEVWQTVGVDPVENRVEPYMIHGAGSYQSDDFDSSVGIPLLDQPFYAPNLGKYCDDANGECGFIGWGQHGPVAVDYESPLININRYKNCGNGVIEHTMVHHVNMGSDRIINRLDAPFGSVRMSTFRDMVITNSDSEDLFKQEDLGRYDTVPETRQAEDTMGYVVFAQDLPSPNSGKLFPLKDGLSHTVMSGGCDAAPDQYPYRGAKCRIEQTVEDGSGTRSAVAIRGTPSDDYFTPPCDKDRPNHCVNKFKFKKFGTNNYCRPYGISIACRLDNNDEYLNNFANTSADKSFVKFSAPGVGEFTSSAGIVYWSFPAGAVFQLIFNTIAGVDKSLSEINALIESNPDAFWEFDYFNPPGAGGLITAKNGVIHWSIKISNNSYWIYFYPDAVDGESDIGNYVRNKFPPGTSLEIVYDYGRPESDNLAMAHVYGNDFSSSRGVTDGWPILMVGQGNEGSKPRDANFYNIVTTANRNSHGGSHHYRQYFVLDTYNGISTRAKKWVDDVIHDNYNVRLGDSGTPEGRTIDLYRKGSSVGATVGESFCADATKACTGSTTPKSGSMALVEIKCGNQRYIGSNLYYFAKDLGDGKLRPYICKDDKNARGVWTLLGFFPENACSSLEIGFTYDGTMCGQQTSPTASPTKSPITSTTESPTTSPSKSPTASPTKSPTASPTKSPTTSTTESPTSGECEEDVGSRYFHKLSGQNKAVTKTCGWLRSKNSNRIAKLCKGVATSGEFGPAKEVCPKTCKSCDQPPPQSPTASPTKLPTSGECEEDASSRYFHKLSGQNKAVTKTCGWLRSKNSNRIAKLCKGVATSGEFGPAKEVCSKTCKSCE